MHQDDCFDTLVPRLDVVSAFPDASVVIRVSVGTSVEVPGFENMYYITLHTIVPYVVLH